ncbi:hypothetical protein OEZ85_005223 [Tetradesmus obliquus]|uniref:Expansin-like EG45 domain-containing protein n=1 Tax=Tetradesmus obliquus TaxID=3088 RepID=A0ABY8UHA6_TETOB|nr:hypothetical protein OEZ85_005223 [Tetradesmus obliquus]
MRSACPKIALDVAATVSRNRVACCASALRLQWLQQQAAALPPAQLRRLLSETSGDDLRALLKNALASAAKSSSEVARMLDGFVGAALLSDSDSELRETLGLNPSTLQMLLTWSPLAEAAAADDVLMPSGRHTGRWAAAAAIAAGPLVLFRPGGVDPSSSSCSTAAWYTGPNSRFATNYPLLDLPGTIRGPPGCNRVITPNPPVEGDFTDDLNSTLSVSPKRPSPDVPVGEWIPGRVTFYGADDRLEASRLACGEPPGQYGILAQGACGYTNSDGSLPFPREMYAAAADANADYPGSCGRCYQIRCRTGPFENNGRQMRSSDLPFNRGVYVQGDNEGRPWPGSPFANRDITWTQCWDEERTITVRIADACPCQYLIAETGEIRHQPWCCGGANHFDISFWAFEKLAHPSYGVMKMEYRPVDCETNAPLRSIPGFVNQTIFGDTIEPGWKWRPYSAKNAQLLVRGQGVDGSVATCASLSQGGAFVFACRQCNATGYQPFAKARTLSFDIRSNTRSDDPFASSTPGGALPPLKLFMMNDEAETYCGAEVVLGNATTNSTQYATRAEGDWYRVQIPLSSWQCDRGSVGSLTNVDRVDFQNINERDADVCLDNIALV